MTITKTNRYISVILSVVCMISVLYNPIITRAEELDTDVQEIIINEIDEDGNFTFEYGNAMRSTSFYIDEGRTGMFIWVKATSTGLTDTYYITLKGSDGTSIKKTFNADGTWDYDSFSGLSTGVSYWLYFSKPLTTYTVSGEGRID